MVLRRSWSVGGLYVLALGLASLGLLGMLLLKSVVDIDTHFDSWWYHFPYAARLVGLVPPDAFQFEPVAAARYEGFPMLHEFLQGVFWRVTGRPESANLVSFLSLLGFIWFLRHYFGIALWLAVPALLAVPLVQGQATSTYVDLSSNLAFAAFVLLIYLAYTKPDVVDRKFLLIMVFSAFAAAASKMQLIPLVGLGCLFAAHALRNRLDRALGVSGRWKQLILVALYGLLIFIVPVKNLLVHGNPVYPIEVTVLGQTLNHAEKRPPEDLGGGELAQASGVEKWFYSVFEIGMGPVINVQRWSIDSAAPEGAPLGIQGGLFGYYVVFHLGLFILLLLSPGSRGQRAIAIAFVLLSMASAALMPASYLLRYYMFWFIGLMSLNLYFLSHSVLWTRAAVSTILFGFVLVVVDATDQNFVRAKFKPVQELLQERVDTRILNQAQQYPASCLVLDYANEPFFYAAIWHKGTYAVTAGPFFPEMTEEIGPACGDLPVIYSP